MSDEAQYSFGTDTNNSKYDDQTAPPPSTRGPIGFSTPIAPHSLDSAPSYNVVTPPIEGLIKAKQRAQEVAARLLISPAGVATVAATVIENSTFEFDFHDFGFNSIPPDVKPHTMSSAPLPPISYGCQNDAKA